MKKDKVTTPPEEGTNINWSEILQRVEKARESLERGAAPSSKEKGAILKARARVLARETEEAGAARHAALCTRHRQRARTDSFGD